MLQRCSESVAAKTPAHSGGPRGMAAAKRQLNPDCPTPSGPLPQHAAIHFSQTSVLLRETSRRSRSPPFAPLSVRDWRGWTKSTAMAGIPAHHLIISAMEGEGKPRVHSKDSLRLRLCDTTPRIIMRICPTLYRSTIKPSIEMSPPFMQVHPGTPPAMAAGGERCESVEVVREPCLGVGAVPWRGSDISLFLPQETIYSIPPR